MKLIRLLTLAPGHFHAALVQKRMLPGIAARCYVYAPLDADTLAHVARISSFNTRPGEPTAWDVDLRAGSRWVERFAREQPGNTVILSGRNRPKIELMQLAVSNGLHVVADKPWVIEFEDFEKLAALYERADLHEVLVWDVMTERYEVTTQLQRELIRDPDVFGRWQVGSPAEPALALSSTHHLKKTVAGQPLLRPWWWFDATISGEAMADVGTHLADLALGLLAPDDAVDYQRDIHFHGAESWPLLLSEEQFQTLTGLPGFPAELAPRLVNGQLYYAGNNTASFTLRGTHVKLETLWEYETPAGGGDLHSSVARGTKARVEVRQQPGEMPEVFVTATNTAEHIPVVAMLRAKCAMFLGAIFPGLDVEDLGTEARLVIPDDLRTSHESHFAKVMEEFTRYFNAPRVVPPWERPNALAKYYITTKAVALARENRPTV
jgi:predicted dehydrogenase